MDKKIVEYIKKNQIREAIDYCMSTVDDSTELYSNMLVLRKRLQKIEDRSLKGVSSQKDDIEEVKITDSLIRYLSGNEPEILKRDSIILSLRNRNKELQSQIDELKKEKDEIAIKLKSIEIGSKPKVNFAIDHIYSTILPYYLGLNAITVNDLKSAMDEILNQIVATTIVINNKNNARIGVFEVISNGRFRILAQKNISSRRLVDLEQNFSHDSKEPQGVIGYCVANKELVFCPCIKGSKYEPWYYMTDYNKQKRRHEANGIICIPIYERSYEAGNENKVIVVLSVSVSNDDLNESIKKELVEYCHHIEHIYKSLKKRIIYDPRSNDLVTGITISGLAGSGKTTLVLSLMSKLEIYGWQKFQISNMFRGFCELKGVYDVKEVELLPDKLHRDFDDFQKQTLIESNKIIIESRFSGLFVKEIPGFEKKAVTVYLKCPLNERIRRYASKNNQRLMKDASEKIDELDRLNYERCLKLYQKNYTDENLYDLVIDSKKMSTDEMVEVVLDKIKEKVYG